MYATSHLIPIIAGNDRPTPAQVRAEAQSRVEAIDLDKRLREMASYCVTRDIVVTGTFGAMNKISSGIRAMGRTWDILITTGAAYSCQVWVDGRTVYRSTGSGESFAVVAFRVGPWVDAVDSAISMARSRQRVAVETQEATEIFEAFAPINL
jgi:hypothetical protein